MALSLENRHILNQMKPVNYIFLFRSIIDIKNKAKNKQFVDKQEADTGLYIHFSS